MCTFSRFSPVLFFYFSRSTSGRFHFYDLGCPNDFSRKICNAKWKILGHCKTSKRSLPEDGRHGKQHNVGLNWEKGHIIIIYVVAGFWVHPCMWCLSLSMPCKCSGITDWNVGKINITYTDVLKNLLQQIFTVKAFAPACTHTHIYI